jgi:hypothetical protein
MRVGRALCEMAHMHTGRDFCSGDSQNTKVLKVISNIWSAVVLSSKAGAYKSLVSDRKPSHKVRGAPKIYKIPPYCLRHRKEVLTAPVCRVPKTVYIHKILMPKILLLKNGEIHNTWVLM